MWRINFFHHSKQEDSVMTEVTTFFTEKHLNFRKYFKGTALVFMLFFR